MTDLRKAVEMALEALDTLLAENNVANREYAAKSSQALHQALAQPKHEPVAWRKVLPGGRKTDEWESARVGDYNRGWNDYRKAAKAALENLYTTPPAQPAPVQEPVAWRNKVFVGDTKYIWNYTEAKVQDQNGNDLVRYEPLYAKSQETD